MSNDITRTDRNATYTENTAEGGSEGDTSWPIVDSGERVGVVRQDNTGPDKRHRVGQWLGGRQGKREREKGSLVW